MEVDAEHMEVDVENVEVDFERLEVDVERTRLQHDVQRWLSAPDPWTNHKTAIKTHHNGTATWFTRGKTFSDWKTEGSVLWIHGIPGSGKTVLCSMVIQDIWSMCQIGLANLAFFYFDHRDTSKQDARALLSSLLVQLCNQSDRFCEVISSFYMAHDRGSRQPREDELMQCLRNVISQGKLPVYLIVDGLDECPDSSSLASQRAEVLEITLGLINAHPRVHLCITSRLEVDIRRVLEPLKSHTVSLDVEHGQRNDIADYVKFVIHTDSTMREWPEEDKTLVIDTITQDSGGMFQWASCQLETLGQVPLQSIQHALREFPKGLNETYERTLRGINKKWEYAHRIFQCLSVSARPLRAEELAEVFVIEVDADSTGIPEFNARWRPKDPEEAVLSACSSLVAVVGFSWERTVQFSHISVQQFLTSDRVANSKDVSKFLVLLEPAHTFLARACLSLLLQQDGRKEKSNIQDSPLHSYAAKHWVDHARFGNVSSIIQEGMERLFDRDRPHFAAWIRRYNLDRPEESPGTPFVDPVPLYYAALCGFYELAGRLLITHPQDVNARGGRCVTPLNAALDKGHVKIAQLLLQHGADVNARDDHDRTPLHLAAECGDPDLMRWLIDRNVDTSAMDEIQETPLSVASRKGRLEAARLLLEHSTDKNHRDSLGRTPLHVAAENGHYDITSLLLEYDADVHAVENNFRTPLHLAAEQGKLAVAQLLLERGADVDAHDEMAWTALHFASQQGHLELVGLLLEHRADVLARNDEDHTFLDVAWERGPKDIIDVNALYEDGQTSLHIASQHGDPELMRWLIDLKVNPSANPRLPSVEDEDQETPLFPASRNGKLEATRLLLDAGANANHQNWQEMTPLHGASENGYVAVTQLLLDRNAKVDARHVYHWTPLHLASWTGKGNVTEVLLGHGAEVDAKNDSGWTPLHMASQEGHSNVVELLLARDADVNTKVDGETALHLAAFYGHLGVAQVLLKNDANLGIENKEGKTPLTLASKKRHHDVAQLLERAALDRGSGGERVSKQQQQHLPLFPTTVDSWGISRTWSSPPVPTPFAMTNPSTSTLSSTTSICWPGSTQPTITSPGLWMTGLPPAMGTALELPHPKRIEMGSNEKARKRYACNICGKCYSQQQGLTRHVRDTHAKLHTCMYCDFKWSRPYHYKSHLEERHPNVDPGTVLGMAAGSRRRSTIIERDLPQHVSSPAIEPVQRSQAEPWQRPMTHLTAVAKPPTTTSSAMPSMTYVPQPESSHWQPTMVGKTSPELRPTGPPTDMGGTSKRGYSCGTCGRSFLQPQGLNRHIREKHKHPSSCTLCDFKWILLDHYRSHLKMLHPNADCDAELRAAVTAINPPQQQVLPPIIEHDEQVHSEIRPYLPMLPPPAVANPPTVTPPVMSFMNYVPHLDPTHPTITRISSPEEVHADPN